MGKIILQNVRGSFVYVTAPRKNKDGTDGSYSLQIILAKDDPQIKKINCLVSEAAKEKFGDKIKMGMIKTPLRDGDKERDSEEYEGMMFMNANGKKKPGIVNRHNEPADIDDIEELCYSGAYFNVSVNIYGFEGDEAKGVAVGLNNIMLRKKGDRLDGSTSASDDFADFADDGEEESSDDDW